MEIRDLTPEQMEKLRACNTTEDILALAREEGYQLSDEQLQEGCGGSDWCCMTFCHDVEKDW